MSESGNGDESVRFTLRLPSKLDERITSDAKDKALTKTALVRMILMTHYAREEAEWRARQFADGQVPVTP